MIKVKVLSVAQTWYSQNQIVALQSKGSTVVFYMNDVGIKFTLANHSLHPNRIIHAVGFLSTPVSTETMDHPSYDPQPANELQTTWLMTWHISSQWHTWSVIWTLNRSVQGLATALFSDVTNPWVQIFSLWHAALPGFCVYKLFKIFMLCKVLPFHVFGLVLCIVQTNLQSHALYFWITYLISCL